MDTNKCIACDSSHHVINYLRSLVIHNYLPNINRMRRVKVHQHSPSPWCQHALSLPH